MSMDMIYTKHAEEIGKYLASKLPDVPPHTAQEISAYIGQKTHILVVDMLREYENDRSRQEKMIRKRFDHNTNKCLICEHSKWSVCPYVECSAANNFKYYKEKAGE